MSAAERTPTPAADMRRERWVKVSPWAGEWKLIAMLLFGLVASAYKLHQKDERIDALKMVLRDVQDVAMEAEIRARPLVLLGQNHGPYTTAPAVIGSLVSRTVGNRSGVCRFTHRSGWVVITSDGDEPLRNEDCQ